MPTLPKVHGYPRWHLRTWCGRSVQVVPATCHYIDVDCRSCRRAIASTLGVGWWDRWAARDRTKEPK